MCDFFPYPSEGFILEFDKKETKLKASSRLPYNFMLNLSIAIPIALF